MLLPRLVTTVPCLWLPPCPRRGSASYRPLRDSVAERPLTQKHSPPLRWAPQPPFAIAPELRFRLPLQVGGARVPLRGKEPDYGLHLKQESGRGRAVNWPFVARAKNCPIQNQKRSGINGNSWLPYPDCYKHLLSNKNTALIPGKGEEDSCAAGPVALNLRWVPASAQNAAFPPSPNPV